MNINGYRCAACGKLTYPHRLICDVCGGRTFKEEALTGEARLLTHTRVYHLPAGIDRPWLDFGIVEFENGVRVSGQLEVRDRAETGMRLTATVGTVRVIEGEEIQGFIFREI